VIYPMERRLLEKCRDLFRLWGFPPEQTYGEIIIPRSHQRMCWNDGPTLRHAAWMVEEMIEHIEENLQWNAQPDLPKVNRWIGFIQGVMWMSGFRTVDELRNDVIEAKKVRQEEPCPCPPDGK